ncbi:hypothetical protein BJ138DRAFT_1144758 [Hygrophoropsis aurantiaca]|uniref:Uncharacterized protein n=1 Tax=Hygrophoropsis aurantiaca TaxID=72124 RepID=A0ACB8AM89_9AGAM|nr:hypothetical protein BJ138DRAFT_1144758 [Hygrophoropsis aurantiaca]
MSCSSSATTTLYETITTSTTSTSYSSSVTTVQQSVTTIVTETCLATGTVSGTTGCISSGEVTHVSTVGGGQTTVQVPVIVTVPVTETTATQTLYGSECANGLPSQNTASSSPPSSSPGLTSSSPESIATSILSQSTPPPSTFSEMASTTLADGQVVQTVIYITSTYAPSAVYVTTAVANPSLQTNQSGGSGTNVTPIVGGVVGGFLGLVALVGSLWFLCRKRRTWDDIFDKEAFQDEDDMGPHPVRKDRNRLDMNAEPKPYQYGLVGQVSAPSGLSSSGSTSSPRPSASVHQTSFTASSIAHSRANSAMSMTPLLHPNGAVSPSPSRASSRPSTAGSVQTVLISPRQRQVSATASTIAGARSLSVISTQASGSAPPARGPSPVPVSLTQWNPNMDLMDTFDPLSNRTGTPVPAAERRILQIANDVPTSPTSTIARDRRPSSYGGIGPLPPKTSQPSRASAVIVHTDGGRAQGWLGPEPPAYSEQR